MVRFSEEAYNESLRHHPYKNGVYLSLRSNDEQPFGRDLQVRIAKVHDPFTMSCVLEVDLPQTDSEFTRAVLKLYDWRFAVGLRDDKRIAPWGPKRRSAYDDHVRSGWAFEFLDKLRNDNDYDEPPDGWDVAEEELYLHDCCVEFFKDERAVYDKLRDHQGSLVPRLYTAVMTKVRHTNLDADADLDNSDEDIFAIPGILLEYIHGPTFAELTESAIPRTAWQGIVDQGIRGIHVLSDYEILNEDVRPANFMITPRATGANEYRIVMIDFALSKIRTNESVWTWGCEKASRDEEGRLGYLMQRKLRKVGFELDYKPSRRFAEWGAYEIDDEMFELLNGWMSLDSHPMIVTETDDESTNNTPPTTTQRTTQEDDLRTDISPRSCLMQSDVHSAKPAARPPSSCRVCTFQWIELGGIAVLRWSRGILSRVVNFSRSMIYGVIHLGQ